MKYFLKSFIIYLLTIEARLVLRKYKPNIIAITGSVGKTTTKDAIYTVLSKQYSTRKSEKSFNSEIGVPLTILDLPNAWSNPFKWTLNLIKGLLLITRNMSYPIWLVLEIGADQPGDIRQITGWIRPDIVVLTQYSKVPVHVEFFNSSKEVIREKQYLPRSLKEDGILVTNGDDELQEKEKMPEVRSHLRYGFDKQNDVAGTPPAFQYEKSVLSGMRFQIKHDNKSVAITNKGFVGRQHIYPLLAAFAVGVSLEIDIDQIVQALNEHVPPPGRMRLITGKNGSVILDDSYNSSPIAVSRALATLSTITASGKKIAVLGDMMELGRYSVPSHKKVGEEAANVVDLLLTVGVRSRATAESARAKIGKERVHVYEDSRTAGRELKEIIQDGDVILVKGSQAVRMERVIERIMAYSISGELVRQDREWQNR